MLDERPGVRPQTHLFHRGDHRQPKQAVQPGDLTIAAPDGGRLEITDANGNSPSSGPAAGLRPAPGQRTAPPRRTRAGQSGLAASLRPRPGRDARRLRRAGLTADASRAARLAGRRAGRFRLEPETAAPADHELDDLPAIVAPRSVPGRHRFRQCTAAAAIPCGGSTRSRCATASCSSADGSIERCSARRCRWSRIPWDSSIPPMTRRGAAFTFKCGAPGRCRCSRPLTHRS